MLARRLLLLAAILMLLTALAAGLSPDPEPEPPASREAAGASTSQIVEHTMSAAEQDQTVEARIGDLVRLEVEGDLLDAVVIEQLDRIDAIEPTTPARFEVFAERAGVYPIRLIEADRPIGRLAIRP